MAAFNQPGSKIQTASRWLGWVFVGIHGLVAILLAINFGQKGSEWWPLLFFVIDFPIAYALLPLIRQLSEWPLWLCFLALVHRPENTINK